MLQKQNDSKYYQIWKTYILQGRKEDVNQS